MFNQKLEEKIFNSEMSSISDTLTIISGYIGAETVSLLKKYPNKKFTIIYGMYASDGISKALHDTLVDLQSHMPWIDIKYSLIPIHSKIYCWSKNNIITEVLVGSANFSINGLRRDFKETLYPISSLAYEEYKKYENYILNRSISCLVANKFKTSPKSPVGDSQPNVAQRICRINLLDSKGQVPTKSGLNWGKSNGKVVDGDAYLPIRVDYIRTFPDLFPQKKYVNGVINTNSLGKITRENDVVELIWDDKKSMIGLLEGTNTIDDVEYPNKLCSSNNKKELGDYIRERIEKKLGRDIFNASSIPLITKDILQLYGRTHIDISKIADGIYYLDFSV